jgi:hypothetical protein
MTTARAVAHPAAGSCLGPGGQAARASGRPAARPPGISSGRSRTVRCYSLWARKTHRPSWPHPLARWLLQRTGKPGPEPAASDAVPGIAGATAGPGSGPQQPRHPAIRPATQASRLGGAAGRRLTGRVSCARLPSSGQVARATRGRPSGWELPGSRLPSSRRTQATRHGLHDCLIWENCSSEVQGAILANHTRPDRCCVPSVEGPTSGIRGADVAPHRRAPVDLDHQRT